jgi:hypothetical protein
MGQAVAVTDDAPTSNSSDAVLISTDSKESGLWLWQGDAPSPQVISPAQVSRPAHPSSHHARCGMGWLDSAAYRIGPHINRYINDPAPG